jgi:hypothetical protein
MWDLEQYVDESIIEACKKSFARVYPEFRPYLLGASQDRTCIIVECEMPDGTFYFRVTENSVSSSYNTAEDADRA